MMRIALLGNVNLAMMGPLLSEHEVHVFEVGSVPAALIDHSSDLHNKFDAVIVHLDGDEFLASGDLESDNLVLDAARGFAHLHPATLVLLNTLRTARRSARSFAEAGADQSLVLRRAQWDFSICALARDHSNVAVLDLPTAFGELTNEDTTSLSYWYLGRLRYTRRALTTLALEYANALRGWLNQARKVLVLDLDNTLWGGVLGEDGPGGVALSEDGLGRCYRDFQRAIRSLASCGTLLALASKNDDELVLQMLSNNPLMVLDESDFSSIKAGWGSKVISIQAIAQELNVGLDSIVFIDDSQVERLIVSEALPEVAVPEFPTRPELITDWFLNDVAPRYFPRTNIGREDSSKAAQYRARRSRLAVAESTDDSAALSRLGVELRFYTDDERFIARLSQLTQKTNQFNLTTERLTPTDVLELMRSEQKRVIAVDYRDRFGEEGIVGMAIIDLDIPSVSNLLLSCRVLARGVEDALLAVCCELVRGEGATSLQVTFRRTERNDATHAFLRRIGFDSAALEAVVNTATMKEINVRSNDTAH